MRTQLISQAFSTIGPGMYTAASDTPAYPLLRAMVLAGSAKMLGERFGSGGRVALTVQIGAARSARQNPSITIGREFFVTALKDYSDWKQKWWREVIQNSVDAGAKNIALTAVQNQDGTWTCACEDDGGGMDEDVLLNKFLVLGGTTKKDATGAAGGFGKAKELIVLPWLSWKIHSRDKIAAGSGIEYEVSSAPMLHGTRIEAVMPADQYTYGGPAMAFVGKCYLPGIRFAVNGEVVKADLKGKDLVEQLEGKMDIYFTPHKTGAHSVFVRSKGLFMFEQYIGDVPGFIVAELTGRSIDLLTANRDGFRDYSTRHTLERFAERIAKDKLSGLRAKKGLVKQKYEGTGQFRAQVRAAETTAWVGPMPEVGPAGTSLSDTAIQNAAEAIGAYKESDDAGAKTPMGSSLPNRDVVNTLLHGEKFHGAEQLEAAIKQLVWEPDFYLINDVEGYRVPAKLKPETMTPTVLRLAKVWTELCRYVLMQLGSDARFGVGFHISESTAASYMNDNGNWLMLNPFKDMRARTKLWKPTDQADLQWLYAASIHEATHLADNLSYHDESFAAALTHNMAKCADGFRKIKKIVAAIGLHGGLAADE